MEGDSIRDNHGIVEGAELLGVGKEDGLAPSNLVPDSNVEVEDLWVNGLVFGCEDPLDIIRVRLEFLKSVWEGEFVGLSCEIPSGCPIRL
jgi:hypothetical protein